jgi:aspartate aminotransferase-like enzyme
MQTVFEYNVLAPGPVNLHPKVREALALPMIHHRTPEFDKILARTLQKLKNIFRTEQPAFILSSTGSGGMESLLVNTLSPGDEVLGIDSGKFGERWCEMAKIFGAQVTILKTKWGDPVKVSEVAQHLSNHPNTRAVLCQACETSTGVLHPIRELGELIHQYPNTLFLVDGITALGAVPMPMDEWHIDGIVGGSQKAFMLPTGLSFVAFSKKAWARIPDAQCARYYFDVRKELKANQSGETFFSSNVTMIRALDVVLDLILEKGWENHLERIAERANFTRHFAGDLGLLPYSHSPSNSITALLVPAGIDGQKVRAKLEEKFHVTIMGGQDQAKGKIIRIGHMGHITWDQMQNLFLQLREVLLELKPDLALAKSKAQLELEMKAWVLHDHA